MILLLVTICIFAVSSLIINIVGYLLFPPLPEAGHESENCISYYIVVLLIVISICLATGILPGFLMSMVVYHFAVGYNVNIYRICYYLSFISLTLSVFIFQLHEYFFYLRRYMDFLPRNNYVDFIFFYFAYFSLSFIIFAFLSPSSKIRELMRAKLKPRNK